MNKKHNLKIKLMMLPISAAVGFISGLLIKTGFISQIMAGSLLLLLLGIFVGVIIGDGDLK